MEPRTPVMRAEDTVIVEISLPPDEEHRRRRSGACSLAATYRDHDHEATGKPIGAASQPVPYGTRTERARAAEETGRTGPVTKSLHARSFRAVEPSRLCSDSPQRAYRRTGDAAPFSGTGVADARRPDRAPASCKDRYRRAQAVRLRPVRGCAIHVLAGYGHARACGIYCRSWRRAASAALRQPEPKAAARGQPGWIRHLSRDWVRYRWPA